MLVSQPDGTQSSPVAKTIPHRALPRCAVGIAVCKHEPPVERTRESSGEATGGEWMLPCFNDMVSPQHLYSASPPRDASCSRHSATGGHQDMSSVSIRVNKSLSDENRLNELEASGLSLLHPAEQAYVHVPLTKETVTSYNRCVAPLDAKDRLKRVAAFCDDLRGVELVRDQTRTLLVAFVATEEDVARLE